MKMLSKKFPDQMGEGSSRRMTTAATPANLASTLYSRAIKVLAPSLISWDTSWIFLFTVCCLFTHRYRYTAKAKAIATMRKDRP